MNQQGVVLPILYKTLKKVFIVLGNQCWLHVLLYVVLEYFYIVSVKFFGFVEFVAEFKYNSDR